jgi:hypothetical protein
VRIRTALPLRKLDACVCVYMTCVHWHIHMKTCTHKVSYIHIKVPYVMSYVMLNAYDMSYDMCVSACMCVCVCVCVCVCAYTHTHTHTHGLEKKKRGNSFFGLHELSLQTNFFVAVGRPRFERGAPHPPKAGYPGVLPRACGHALCCCIRFRLHRRQRAARRSVCHGAPRAW